MAGAGAISATERTFRSPVPEAYSWLEGRIFPPDRPLLNLSQAAPMAPPPEPLRRAMSEAVLNLPSAHLYGPVLGMPELRAEVAARWSREDGGAVAPEQVAITTGCNQAFAAAVAAIAGASDEVVLPTPWYFNHKMWLDMSGVTAVPLPVGNGMLPDPDRAAALITARTRAIALVSPNNPCGVEYPPDLIGAFFDLAERRGIALILDETYRDFRRASAPPHDLFSRAGWDATLIQLYSFSKAYRLTGHRVGAMTTSPARLAEVEKFIDTVTICPTQLGQIGALWGLRNLSQWLAGERAAVLGRAGAIRAGFAPLGERGWRLLGLGGFFAYVGYPQALPSRDFARRLLDEAAILTLPGAMFAPPGDATADRQLRIAFANIDEAGIATMFGRLLSLPNRALPSRAEPPKDQRGFPR